MTDKIHEHGSLAGIELGYTGVAASNRYSREIPMAPTHRTVEGYDPVQARMMDKADIKAVRKWHVDAALRAKSAGFDLIYVYCGHSLSIQMHFLSRQRNTRTDEYGGSLENRVRLFREILEETKEAVGDTCAVPVRFAVDELRGPKGITHDAEGRDIIEMLAEMPDLWDVNVSDWHNDSVTSRFAEQGLSGRVYLFREISDDKTCCRGRTLYLAGRHGFFDQTGCHGFLSAPPVPPLPIRSCRKKSKKAVLTISANVLAATSASVAIISLHPSGARRTRPWERNGARAGIPSAFNRKEVTHVY